MDEIMNYAWLACAWVMTILYFTKRKHLITQLDTQREFTRAIW